MSYIPFDNITGDTNGLQSVSYTYNADGIRTSKTVGEVKHEHHLNGSQIVYETWVESGVENFILYIYDEIGSPIGLSYRNSSLASGVYHTCFFEKNLQGDIIAVYNSSGTKIGTYTYDAWGNVTTTFSGSNVTEILIVTKYNPFRYRGYFYDVETQLYYLQTRYYNPSWGRFINADGYVSTGTGVLGYNMYSYCNNNPMLYVDLEGDILHIALAVKIAAGIIIGLIGLCVTASVIAEINMPSQEEHYNRNSKNEPPPTEAEVPKDWLTSDKNDTEREHGPSANAHQFTSPDRSNVKYVSPDGTMEAIYNSKGELVEDPRDVGTYNFCPSGKSMIGHYIQDVRPWIRWGNSPEDTTTPWQRMWGLLGFYD